MTSNSQAIELINSYTSRMENLLDQIDSLKDDLKDLKAEARGRGLNDKALTKLVAIRRKDTADKETEFLNDLLLYASATGTQMRFAFPEPEPTPLEKAIGRAGKATADVD